MQPRRSSDPEDCRTTHDGAQEKSTILCKPAAGQIGLNVRMERNVISEAAPVPDELRPQEMVRPRTPIVVTQFHG